MNVSSSIAKEKLFPLTEEAKAESKELEELRSKVRELAEGLSKKQDTLNALAELAEQYRRQRDDLSRKVDQLEVENKALKQGHQGVLQLAVKREQEILQATDEDARKKEMTQLDEGPRMMSAGETPAAATPIGVDVTLRRVLTDFKVITNKEVIDIDESSWEGKILARGLDGFFQEPKGIGKIMSELVRKYSIADGGGNRETVNDRLAMLVSKGILDRKQEAGQWTYYATPEFSERVKENA